MEALPSPFTLLGGAIGSVVAMLAGSFFGDKGSLIGAASGAVITATVSTFVEHNAKKAREKLKGPELPDVPVHADAVLYGRDLTKIRELGEHRRKIRKYKMAAAFSLLAVIPFIAAFSVLSVVDGATGGTVKGFTVWNPPTPTKVVTPAPEITTVTPTQVSPTGSVTPTVSPSATLTPTVSPDPSPSLSQTRTTPAPTVPGSVTTGTETPGDTPPVGQPTLKVGAG